MILRIRDSNGKVQEILAIKGNDYVLTEEDIQKIAKIVNGNNENYVEQIEYNSTDGSLQGRVYIVDRNNTQTSRELRITSTAESIPVRNANGNFYVGMPRLDYECTPKKYVDDLIKGIEDRLAAGGL